MIELKEGQKVLDIDGNEYLIEKGDILEELSKNKVNEKLLQESAFVVGNRTINDVVTILLSYKEAASKTKIFNMIPKVPSEQGLFLFEKNLVAVRGRYGDSTNLADDIMLSSYTFRKSSEDPIQLYKSLNAYLYQIAEDPIYDTPFYKELELFKDKVAKDVLTDSWDSYYWGE